MKINLNDVIVKEISELELDQYLDLITLVKANMKHPEWLGDFTKEDYINLMRTDSHIYSWFYNNQMIAAGVLIPATMEDLNKFFSQDLNFKEVVDLGPEMVRPDYIGNKLQDQIIKFIEKKAIEFGYKYALGTIHPDNLYSIRNLVNNDYDEIGFVVLKRGPRKVYRKALNVI